MEFSDTLAYVVSLTVITLAPGPLVLFLLVRTAGNDRSGAIGFSLGIALGDILVISIICLGLGTWLQASPQIFEIGAIVFMLYIGWLAYGIWNGSLDFKDKENHPRKGVTYSILAGTATCILTPHTIGFYTLLLPSIVDVNSINFTTFLLIALLTLVALSISFGIVIGFADRICKLQYSSNSTACINRIFAVTLVFSGSWMVLP